VNFLGTELSIIAKLLQIPLGDSNIKSIEDSEPWLGAEPKDIVLILQASNVEGCPRQVCHPKLESFLRVIASTDNCKVRCVTKTWNLVLLELDPAAAVVAVKLRLEADIWLVNRFQYISLPSMRECSSESFDQLM